MASTGAKCGRLSLALPLGLLLACGEGSGPPGPPPPLPSLVYQEVSGPVGRIVQVKADGSGRAVRWEGNSTFGPLSVAPDGRVLFRSGLDWWLLPAGAGPATAFTVPAGAPPYSEPEWSPDGSLIAWIVQWSGGFGLGIATPGSATASVITGDTLHVFEMGWSPDGAQLVFTAVGGPYCIYAVSREGTGLRRLTPDTFWITTKPQWSHSGQLISFIAGDLLTVAPDGTGLRRVTSNGDFAETAYWSIDDQTLMTVGSGPSTLSSVNAASGAQQSLGRLWPGTVPWSPDEQLILYAGGTNGDPMSRIGVARADGRNPVLVTPDSVSVAGVSWLPGSP